MSERTVMTKIFGSVVCIKPSIDTMSSEYHWSPITAICSTHKLNIDVMTVRVPNGKGDRLVYVDDYVGASIYYVPAGEGTWSKNSIEYRMTEIEKAVLEYGEDFAGFVAMKIKNKFNKDIDVDFIEEFGYRTCISSEYDSIDEVKTELLKRELNK